MKDRITHHRDGSSIAEVSLAVVIASVTVIAIAQLLAVTARQHRLLDQHLLALIEVGNVMEEVMSRPFDEIAGELPPAVTLSELCQQQLPDARLEVQVEPEADVEDARRVTVRIEWSNLARQRPRPVQLVAWKYRQREAQP
jgi:hypothetical protein